MGTNDRIIRDEQYDEVIFEGASPSTPRIDLILGVALAIVASVLGALGSLGFTAPLSAERDTGAERQIAQAEPTVEPTMALAASDAPEVPEFWVEAPQPVAAGPVAMLPEDCLEQPLTILDRTLCSIEAEVVENVDAEGRRVAVMLFDAARLALEDPEVAGEIEQMRITVQTLLERAAEFERLRHGPTEGAPAWTQVRELRRAAAPPTPRRAVFGY